MLAQRVTKIKPSATLAMDAKAKALKAQGIDIVNFGAGEPDFDTPQNIKDAAIKAINDGFTKYMPVAGSDELKDAIIDKFKGDNGLDYTRDEIIVSCGGKHSLYNIAQALLSPGDEVIIPSPFWVSYPDQALLNDAVPVFAKTLESDRFMLQIDALQQAITPKSKILILNSPSNPTGVAYDNSKLEAVAEIALRYNLYVVSDEIYEKLVYDGTRHISIASLGKEIKDRTIIVNGLSKSHSMTGWRIGYAAGPKDIIKAMSNIQSQSTSNPTSISQKAAVEALRGPQDFISMMVTEFDKRRKYIVQELNSIDGVSCLTPNGAFYVFPNVSALYGKRRGNRVINSSLDLAMYLLEEANVAVVHGEPFGSDIHIRLSYALSMQNIQKGIARIKEAISQLN